MPTSLNRRNFLRAGGVAIALPVLESLTPVARAADGKKPVKRMVCLSNNYGVYQKAFFPDQSQAGADYDIPPTLQPLVSMTQVPLQLQVPVPRPSKPQSLVPKTKESPSHQSEP